ncbi:1-acyl-sn-glycerol-3-phosphate acyltransferase [Fodinicurvata sp. EGI_FJ10296]|uniref:1-acyl-sn-glycerol-3-phosphate acyltransferase n=1 Tax=Fodinicurvata sp. EGI_FJ10296 TaxID=3231908 RepID=UPI003456E8CD
MTGTVEIPVWLIILVVVLALLATLDRILVPSVRWFLRRKVNRAIDEVNARLNIKIQQFKLTRRQTLIDLLTYDHKVVQAAEEHARATGTPRSIVMAQVERYAREIVPSFNAYFYFRIGYWIARRVARTFYRVRLGYSDEAGLSNIPANATVIFVMNHRSNMDYVLVAFLAADRTALSYAVGEWARIWPLQSLVRASGAFFIRRNSNSHLYRRVLARYVEMATANGVSQAVFPEGGLSRDGRLRKPKMGLIDYMVRGIDQTNDRDIYFVPVGVNYDRVLEDRALLKPHDPEARAPGRWSVIRTVVGFFIHNVGLAFRRQWYRFGYACVNFGTPVSFRQWMTRQGHNLTPVSQHERFRIVQELTDALMKDIGDLIPVLPVSVVASVLVREDGLTEAELRRRVRELLQQLEAGGARVYIPRRTRDYAVTVGLRQLRYRGIFDESDGLIRVNGADRSLVLYYANAIAHLVERCEGYAPGGAFSGNAAPAVGAL